MSEVQQACPKDSQLMLEWEKYQGSDDFKNSLTWAMAERYTDAGNKNFDYNEPANQISSMQREQIVKGSLWAAFVAGFGAAGGKVRF